MGTAKQVIIKYSICKTTFLHIKSYIETTTNEWKKAAIDREVTTPKPTIADELHRLVLCHIRFKLHIEVTIQISTTRSSNYSWLFD